MTGNENIVLGLIWQIILRWMGQGISRQGLMEWVNNTLEDDYPECGEETVTNFSTDFQNGLRFAALVHCYNAALIDFRLFGSPISPLEHLPNTFNVAEREMKCSQLIDVEDVVNNPGKKKKKKIVILIEIFFR